MRVNGARKAIVASMAVLFMAAVLSAVPGPVAAEPLTLSVIGYVYDAGGNPVSGASVTVTIVETGANRVLTTNALGAYSTTDDDFESAEYSTGDTILVQATKDSETASNTGLVPETDGVVQIDVHFTYEIPEFGSLAGVVVSMGAVAVIGSIAFSRRRKGPK